MATVLRENIGLLNDKITIKVDKAEYLPSFEKALKSYGKKVNIPGFRKGMVPAGVIKKMHGQEVLVENIANIVETQLDKYIQEEKLPVLFQPLGGDHDFNNISINNTSDEYSFSFEIGLRPDVVPADLNAGKLKKYKVGVTDAMIDEEISYICKQQGSLVDEEVVSNDENSVTFSLTETDADGNIVEEGLFAPSNYLFVKGFTEAYQPKVKGLKKGDVLEKVVITEAIVPDNQKAVLNNLSVTEEEAAAKYFKLEITAVKSRKDAEVNEELFKKVFPAKEITTEADFRNELKVELEKSWDKQSDSQIQDQMYHYLIEHTKVDLPEAFLKRYMEKSATQQKNGTPKTEEEINKEYPAFADAVKWMLIKDTLIKESDIQIGADDIRNAIKDQVAQYLQGAYGFDMGTDAPWIQKHIDTMMKDRRYVEETYSKLESEKVFDALLAKTKTVETPISHEDFMKMVEEHNHAHHQH